MKAYIPLLLAILCLTTYATGNDRGLGKKDDYNYDDKDHQEGDDRNDHQEGEIDRNDRDDHQEGDDKNDHQEGDGKDDHQEGDDRDDHQEGEDKNDHQEGDDRDDHQEGDDRNDHQEGDDRDDHQEGDDREDHQEGEHQEGDDRDDHQEGDDRDDHQEGDDREDNQEGDDKPDRKGEYQRLSPEEVYKNPRAKEALEFGAKRVVVKAIFKGDIKKGDYCVTAILYAARQRLSNGTNYRFIVEISNKKGELVLIAKYRVFVSRKGQNYLRFVSYDVIQEGKRGNYDKYDRYN